MATRQEFDAALATHRAAIRHYCLRLRAYKDEDAEDALQETWLRAWRAWPEMTFTGANGALRWLCRIAHNVCVDAVRRERKYPCGPLYDTYPAYGSVAGEVIGRMECERITGLLRHLPPDQRHLLALTADGWCESDLIRLTGASKGTIGSRLHRARTAMREMRIA